MILKKCILVVSILQKDLIDSVKNRTVFFSILFPILLSLLFQFVTKESKFAPLKIAFVESGKGEVTSFFKDKGSLFFKVYPVKDVAKAKKMVQQGRVNAAVEVPEGFVESLKAGEVPYLYVWVDESEPRKSAVLEMLITKFMYHFKHASPPVEVILQGVMGKGFTLERSMIPIWILFVVLGGFMVVASSLVEERERKTLQAVLVTPCSFSEILIGKGLMGFILTTLGGICILGLNKGFVGNVFGSLLVLMIGGFFFSLLGVLVGLILPSHATTNSFGSILYLVLFMPVVLADSSVYIKGFAKVLPSYYIKTGMWKAMFLNYSTSHLMSNFVYIGVWTVLVFLGAYYLLKRKRFAI